MKHRLAIIILMLIQLWLELSTLHLITPTIDEPIHIVRGYAFALRGNDRLRLRGPILANELSGLSLLLEPNLQLPPEDNPIWLDAVHVGQRCPGRPHHFSGAAAHHFCESVAHGVCLPLGG
jgi:hypothetical protein